MLYETGFYNIVLDYNINMRGYQNKRNQPALDHTLFIKKTVSTAFNHILLCCYTCPLLFK
jgi:hypothetical protein